MNEKGSNFVQLDDVKYLLHGWLPAWVILRCWDDKEFKQRLLGSPKETLTSLGFNLPDNLSITMHENKDDHIHLSIPTKNIDMMDIDELNAFVKDIKYRTSGACCATGTCDYKKVNLNGNSE